MTLIPLQAVAAKLESTYGSDATPNATDDAIRVREGLFALMEIQHAFPNENPNVVTNTLSQFADFPPNGLFGTVRIPIWWRGPGAAYASDSLPECDVFLQSCGWSDRTDSFGTQVAYDKQDDISAHKSFTLYGWGNGCVYKFVGCVCTITTPITVGLVGQAEVTVQGIFTEVSTASVPAATYSAVVPPAATGVTFSLDTDGTPYDPIFQNASLDFGARIERIDSPNAADGIERFEIQRINPILRLTIQAPALATYNPYTLRNNVTQQNHDWALTRAQYNNVAFKLLNAYIFEPVRHEEFTGHTALGLSWRGDGVTVTWT